MTKQPDSIKKQLKKIGKRMRQIRKAKGFTNYEKFSYWAGINRSSYSRFESGEDMRVSSLLKVLEAFDMTLPEFFAEGFEEVKKKTKKEPC